MKNELEMLDDVETINFWLGFRVVIGILSGVVCLAVSLYFALETYKVANNHDVSTEMYFADGFEALAFFCVGIVCFVLARSQKKK